MVFDSTQIRNNELLVIFDTTQKRKDDNFGNSMNTQSPKNQSTVEFQLWIWIFYSVFFPTFWISCKRHEQLLEHTLNQWPAFMNLFRSLQRWRASFLSVLELAQSIFSKSKHYHHHNRTKINTSIRPPKAMAI